jgi:hypothetical protein
MSNELYGNTHPFLLITSKINNFGLDSQQFFQKYQPLAADIFVSF